MTRNCKKTAAALTLALVLSLSTSWAKAPDFTIQIPYKGNGTPAAPQQDYYLYMNAAWLKNAKIAPDEGRNSNFNAARDTVTKQLTNMTKQAVKHTAGGTATLDEKNIANLYACIQDQKGRDAAGLGNLEPILKRIEGIANLQEYAETMADMSKHGIDTKYMVGGYGITSDLIDNDRYVIALTSPAALSREMVENTENAGLLSLYGAYIRDTLHLYGYSTEAATAAADKILKLQKDLALHSHSVSEAADPSKISNKLDLAGLQKLYSHIQIAPMLDAGGIGPKQGIQSWYILDPGLVSRFNELYTPEQLPVLKDYAIFSTLSGYGSYLGQDYQKLSASFEKSASGAASEPRPEKRDIQLNEDLLSFTYGRQYATTYFDETRKSQVRSYVQLIMDTYRTKLQQLDWMTPATKRMALKKLDNMDINIGYPEAWQEYLDHLDIKPPQAGGLLIDNILSMGDQLAVWQRSRVGTPVRKDLWEDLTPQTINAGYEPSNNSINFPAGILQPPFFDAKASREANLGRIGSCIAHEITHCFDNNGAQYDEQGRQRNWWQPSDYAEFKARQEKVAAYYSRFILANGTRIKGEQTLSEDIADLGALSCITEIVGHNPEKLRQVYENFGILWRDKETDRFLHFMLTDIHSLPYIRTDAVLSSTDGFYEAYPVAPGDPMYVAPEDRVHLW